MELADMLVRTLPLLDRAKKFLEKKAGFNPNDLTLADVSESKEGERWIITFFYNLPGQETYCEVELSKKDGEMLAFRRLESDEAPRDH